MNLYHPMIIDVADGVIPVTTDFPIRLGNRSKDGM